MGCANPLIDVAYRRYTQTGDAAMERGDYVQAEFAYARAAQNVVWGNTALQPSLAAYSISKMPKLD